MRYQIQEVTSRALWEKFLRENCQMAFFQSWPWGEVMERVGSRVWRFGRYERESLSGLFQVVRVDAKRGRFLHVRHGPVMVKNTKPSWQPVISFLRTLAIKEGAWFIRISPPLPETPDRQRWLSSFGFHSSPIHRMDGEICWILDLTLSEEELFQQMRKTTRYEIRRSISLGVEVVKSTETALLPTFFKLYQQTSQRHGFVPHQGIEEEFEIFAKENKAMLFLGKYHDEFTAGAIIVFYGHQAIYRHGASVPSAAPVSQAVQWQAIREAKKRGMEVYNFWGIAPDESPNHPWRGITMFKKGFGGREVRTIHAQDLAISPFYAIPWTIEVIRKIRRGY